MPLHVKRTAPHLRCMPELSACGAMVRRADPDRFLTALFAPPARREALLTLYAFNVELSRARTSTSQPMLAIIRLQWWREVVDGAVRAHEVATPLAGLLADGHADRGELLALIDAREAELDTVATLGDWLAYVDGTAGGLAMAAGRVLGAPRQARLRAIGAAYGVAGMLRNAHAPGGFGLLPTDVLAAHGLSPGAPAPRDPAMPPVLECLAASGSALLGGVVRVPAAWRAAALPGVLARRDLRRPGRAALRGLGDRLAVVVGAMSGWV